MKEKFKLIATAAAGIEALVGKELRNLGIDCQVENGRAYFSGDQRTIAQTNLWLRTADRVKIIVGEFQAKTFEELFQGIYALDWENYLPIDANFPVAGKSVKSTLYAVSDVQAITKKAIAKKMQAIYHRPENVPLPETGALYQLEVSILKDKVTITLDTTGDSLFKRGYRISKGGAPIKENMAAAIIMLTNWFPDKPFYDPTCGSGTFCIEAALIGMNIAPGFNRDFACEKWDWIKQDVFEQVRDEADAQADYEVELDILGCDVDGRMIEAAKANATEAGLPDVIKFKQMRLQDFKTEKEYGVLISNPPYGDRLLSEAEVTQLYQEMGEVYRPLTTWSKYILTSDLDFEKKYGSRATKKRKLYNGALRVDLYQYWGQRPKRQSKAR
ncbi:MAG: class I SAM-dependent RNA methyltransferase [Streptococcaceae bacterium]|jgi:putative N6-adenine-specific DNA methylase|nr:class I SAM-dependent RNA methyltransferase [Streptococcaceae bacterium]MCH4177378.1 class I SAM-dependent RNA methyltransferase [Streptococcaceae bacterium]